MKILFVCTGNSCRSPMAVGLLKKMATEKKLKLELESCGISTLVGMSASKEAIDILRNQGIDISSHKAKPITRELIDWADFILVMEERHKERIIEEYEFAKGKVYLLTEYANNENKDIIDPIGKPAEVYEGLIIDLQFYLEKVIQRLLNESSPGK